MTALGLWVFWLKLWKNKEFYAGRMEPARNDNLRKLNSLFVQNQFKTYKPNLISDMWKYAQSGGFVVMWIILIDPKTSDESEKSFLPTVTGNKCFIPFLLGQNDSIADSVDSGDDGAGFAGAEFATAIMSSAKCRILISKNVISGIETAYFEGKDGQNFSIPVFDYGDANCLEIPFIILTLEGMYRTDRVVIIMK